MYNNDDNNNNSNNNNKHSNDNNNKNNNNNNIYVYVYIVCICYYVNIIKTYTNSNSTTSCAAYPPNGVQPCFVGGLMALLQQLLIAMQCYPLSSSINYTSTFIHYIKVVNYHNSMGWCLLCLVIDHLINYWLVGGLIHFLFSIIYGIIRPID